MVLELTPKEFTEKFAPIFEEVVQNGQYPWKFNAEHFFPEWRKLMVLGLARTWYSTGIVTGVLFVNNLFSGKLTALVVFWFSKSTERKFGRTLTVLKTAIQAAKDAGAVKISIAAYGKLNGKLMERLYRVLGFEQTETVFELKFL